MVFTLSRRCLLTDGVSGIGKQIAIFVNYYYFELCASAGDNPPTTAHEGRRQRCEIVGEALLMPMLINGGLHHSHTTIR